MSKVRHFALAAAVSLVGGACTPTDMPVVSRPLTRAERLTADWDSLFERRELTLTTPESEKPIQRIGRVFMTATDNILVPDLANNRVLVLDSVGHRLQSLALPVPPTAVESPSMIFISEGLHAYMWVPAKLKLMEYDLRGQRAIREVPLPAPVTDLLPVDSTGFLVYSPAAPEGVLRRVDLRGVLVRAALPIQNEGVRLFHGRTQNGGMSALNDTTVALIEPSRYAVHLIKKSLEGGESELGDSTSTTSFQARPFPDSLRPTEQGKAHTAWWNSFRHADRPFAFQDSLILFSHFASRGIYQARYQISIATTRGVLLADGVDVPEGGRVLGVRGRTVIVGVPPRLANKLDSLTPYRLIRFVARRASPVPVH